MRNNKGNIRGVSSVKALQMPALGNRKIWFYRNFLLAPERTDDTFIHMFNHTRHAMQVLLDREGTEKAPAGICVVIQDPTIARRFPQAFWQATGLVYAGRTRQGWQMRVAWLDEPGGWANVIRELEAGFSIEPVWGSVNEALAEEVIAFWLDESAIPGNVARQRVSEVVQISRDSENRIAGVCTLEFKRNQRLGLPLWYVRAFVSKKYRRSSVGFCLLHSTVDYMQARYDRGEDRQARGIFMEVENKTLQETAHQGLWAYGRFAYIGDNSRGEHMRVQYFQGAELDG